MAKALVTRASEEAALPREVALEHRRSSRFLNFLSTHPSGPERIEALQANVPKVMDLYNQAKQGS